jgi:hypothetical protein
MALYQYNFYFVREQRVGSMLGALQDSRLVNPNGAVSGSVLLPGGARAFAEQGELRTAAGNPLEILALLVEDDDVRLFTSDFGVVAAWLEDVARTTDLAVAFMPGGPDTSAGRPSPEEFIGAVIDEGRLVTAQALMWFAVAVAAGRLCSAVSPAYRKVVAPGLGCLFALVDVAADGSFEILEPGPEPGHLLSAWR